MAEKIFYSMGEVAEMFDVNQSLIRHWESQFGVLKPKRNKKGNRLFSPQDVENLKLIYHLVKERGMTLEGAKRALKRPHGESDGMKREVELMERLQRIRALLVEVREELKEPQEAIGMDDDPETEAVEAEAEAEHVDPAPGHVVSDHEAEPAAELAVPEPETKEPGEPAVPMPEAVEAAEDAGSDAEADGTSDCAGPETDAEAGADRAVPEDEAEEEAEVSVLFEMPPVSGAAATPAGCGTAAAASEPDAAGGENAEPDASASGTIAAGADAPDGAAAGEMPGAPSRRGRRRKEEAEHKELFAFYEQSLF
jgi:DNA-binding transcriptional MerR regulator